MITRFIGLILLCSSLLWAREEFSKIGFCQNNLFGQRKNLENKLKRLGISINDPYELSSIELLKFIHDFYQHYQIEQKRRTIYVSENLKKGKSVIHPIWSRQIDYEAMEWNFEQFCGKNRALHYHHTMAVNTLGEIFLKVIYNKQELEKILMDNFKVALESPTTVSTFGREQALKKHQFARLLADFSYFPLDLLTKGQLKYIVVLKPGYSIESGKKVVFDVKDKLLKFTDSYFNTPVNILENKDLLMAVAEMVWYGLDQSLKDKYTYLSWIRKKEHYYYKKTIGFINEDSKKGLLEDFREHLYYFFINGSYLKHVTSIRYLFFKNSLFKKFYYKSELEKKEIERKKSIPLKDQFEFRLNRDKLKGNYIPYTLIIKSKKIRDNDRFNAIRVKVKKGTSIINFKLEDQLYHGKYRLKQNGVIDLRKYQGGYYKIQSVQLVTKQGRTLSLSRLKKTIKFKDSKKKETLKLPSFNFEKVKEGILVRFEHLNNFVSANFAWKTKLGDTINHYILKLESNEAVLRFHPDYSAQELTLDNVFINGIRVKSPEFKTQINKGGKPSFVLKGSSLLKNKKEHIYKMIFSNPNKYEMELEVHLFDKKSREIISFENIDKLIERENVLLESIKKNREDIIWVKVPDNVMQSKSVEFFYRPKFLPMKSFDKIRYDVTRGVKRKLIIRE